MRFSGYASALEAAGSLASTAQQAISTDDQEIVIEPVNPDIVMCQPMIRGALRHVALSRLPSFFLCAGGRKLCAGGVHGI